MKLFKSIVKTAVSLACSVGLACATCMPALGSEAGSTVGSTFTSGGLTFKITAAGEVSVGTGEVGSAADHSVVGADVTIPQTVSYQGAEYTVTSIAVSAFQNDLTLASVTLPSTVKTIGQKAFYGCGTMDDSGAIPVYGGLSTVQFSGTPGVRYINDNAFLNCYNLKAFTIPASVQSFGSKAFGNCFSFDTLTFEEGTQLAEIGASAFEIDWQPGFAKPKEWTSSDAYTEFDEEFAAWDFASTYAKSKTYGGLRSVVIPKSVQILRDCVFANQRLLESVTFEADSMKWLGDWSFAFCNSLTDVYLPSAGYINSAEEGWLDGYGEYMFACCSNLKTCTFAGEIKAPTAKWICYRMFDGCVNLDKVVFYYNTCVPAAAYGLSPGRYPTMVAWGYNSSDPALYYRVGFCASKEEAVSGGSSLGWAVLRDGTDVSSVKAGMETSDTDGAIVLRGSVPEPHAGYDSWAYVTRGGEKSYRAGQGLDDVAFAYPVSSSDLDFGGVSLSSTAYWYDGTEHRPAATVLDARGTQLSASNYELAWERQDDSGTWKATTDLTSTGSLRAVAKGRGAYSGTAYGEYTIAYLEKDSSFEYDGVTYVVSKGQTASSPAELQVGDGTNLAIDAETNGQVVIPASIQLEGTSLAVPVTGIASRAFGSDKADEACSEISEVVLPEGITTIGDLAFANMSSLGSMTLPSTLTYIGASAFTYCSSLTDVSFAGSTISRIGTSAFAYCSRLRSIELPGIENFLGLVFQNCVMLSSVTFKGNVEGNRLSQFDGCERISSIAYEGGYWDYQWPAGTLVSAVCGTGASTARYAYTIGAKTATYAACKSASTSATVLGKVTFGQLSYTVNGIAAGAFKGTKAKTLVVKCTALTKTGVKNSLKNSKVTVVKVLKSKLAAYKKIFTKANCGAKVNVK